jgi:AraC-like DNA-binding protein
VRKAKELLTTGKFTISEAAYHVGFVDQSHLTRHFKRVFGLPPKRLLSRRRMLERWCWGEERAPYCAHRKDGSASCH